MGFGHRVYRGRDPRADVLKGAIEQLASDGIDLPFAGEVEAYIRAALRRKNPERPLDTNVEFFTAILLDALKIPRQAFTPIFAVARAAGWTAHAREQQRGRPADQAKLGLYWGYAGLSAANHRLEIIIRLDDLDQAILGGAVAAIGVGMVLLDQRLVFGLDGFERRIRTEPHHLQRLALGIEYFSGFDLGLAGGPHPDPAASGRGR